MAVGAELCKWSIKWCGKMHFSTFFCSQYTLIAFCDCLTLSAKVLHANRHLFGSQFVARVLFAVCWCVGVLVGWLPARLECNGGEGAQCTGRIVGVGRQ